MNDLSHAASWAVPGGNGSVTSALARLTSRLREASKRMKDADGKQSLDAALSLVGRIHEWASQHEVRQQVQHPPSNKSRWD